MMRISVCLFFFLMISCSAEAQEGKRDSLLRNLKLAPDDTGKVRLLLEIADDFETNNQDSSIYYLEASKILSSKLGYQRGLYEYYEQSAIVSFTKGNYELAMQQTDTALRTARALKDSGLIVNILVNKGIIYQYLGQFDRQLDYSLQALAILDKGKYVEKYGSLHGNIANAYFNLHQYRKAIDYCFLSIRHLLETGGGYPNRVYATLAQSYAALKMTDSALHFYNIAIVESEKLNDKYAEAAIYGYMADTYIDRRDFSGMLAVSQKSLSLAKELQSNQMLASALYNIAYARYFNGDNPGAKKDIREALDIALKDSLKDELKNIYTIFSYIAAGEKDFNTSIWARQKSDSLQELMLNQELVRSASELEKKYESEKKDQQIILQQSQLQRRRILNYVLVGSAVTLLLIALLSYRSYRQKQKLHQQRISELEKEKQLTATEAVLKGEEQERTRLAKDLHDGLGGMLSGIKFSLNMMKGNLVMTPENAQAFERSIDMLDSSIYEMRRVAHNMMPEALVKFGLDTALKDFCSDINATGALRTTYQSIGLEKTAIEQITAITIYRIVQELIHNTIKHAAAKNAVIQVTKTGDRIAITVEDDGRGFDTSLLKKTKGMGWDNIQNRVEFLKGELDIQSAEGKGTSVHIELNA